MRNRGLLKKWNHLLFFLITTITFPAAAGEIPIEVYGRLPTIEEIAISPCGSYMALVRSVNEDRILYVLSLKDGGVKGMAQVSEGKVRGIMWADEDHVLIMVSTTSGPPRGFSGQIGEFSTLHAYNISGNKVYNVLTADNSFSEFILNVIITTPTVRRINGETIVFVTGLYITDRTLPALFRMNLSKSRLEIVAHGTERSSGWLLDENGRIMSSQRYDSRTQRWAISIRKDGDMTVATSGKAELEIPSISGFSPEGDGIWIRKSGERDPTWYPISFKTGEMGARLQKTQGFRRVAVDSYTSRILGGYLFSADTDLVFFDPERQEIWETVKSKFSGDHVSIVSASEDYQKLILLIDGPEHGYAYYYMDIDSFETSRIAFVYEGLSAVADVRPVEYAAADGMKIPGYLTLPIGREVKNLPLIVLPHGGPAARDTGRFDWWSQALASRGYAVLQPNFRGSDLNWRFMAAGFGEWGRKMQTDLSDGVRYLVNKGIVDAERVCIVGASYGGYAALAGATLDVGVYRCAVSVAGVSDLQALIRHSARRGSSGDRVMRYWDRYFGSSGRRDPVLKTLSPLEHVEKVSIPVMLIHGRDDTVVPYRQSQLMARALGRANKAYEFITLTQEDHWLSRSETRLQMLQESIRFLEKHNPPY